MWKLAYVFCALAGILAGYGVFSLTGIKDDRTDRITKDNTLVREAGDSVFFDGEPLMPAATISLAPTPAVTARPESIALPTEVPAPTKVPEPVEILPELPEITLAPEKTVSVGQAEAETSEERLPSLGSRWIDMGNAVVPQQKQQEELVTGNPGTSGESSHDIIQETITYPAKIFGQTPVINHSDASVSYFEFCYDLITMMESEVQARGFNMNILMTKFALKALFCGVDIEQLDINAPIPRRLAALCLWLAAQVLNESGCDTSSQSAGQYVTDISSCSSAEKKAVAYLYEQGIIKGYQIPGQKFFPDTELKSEEGEVWLSRIKQCWK